MRLILFNSMTGPVWLNPKYVWSVGVALDKEKIPVVGVTLVNFVTGTTVAIRGIPGEIAKSLTGELRETPDYLKGVDGDGN